MNDPPYPEREKPLVWIAGSRADISAMPAPVKASFGFRLRQVQRSLTPVDMKPLSGLAGVQELRERHDGNAYRVVYVVNLTRAIYVLHAFMKKSVSGIGLPRPDAAIITARLQRARALDEKE